MDNYVDRSWFERHMVPCYAPLDMLPQSGKGSRLWDQNGREYIDFAGGIAVSCLGHCHPQVVDALTAQAQKLWHVSNVMTNAPALKLAKKLTDLTFADKVFFTNSGAEANEAALKLARRWARDNFGAQKNQIIAFNQGFHGRTFFTVTVGGQLSYSDGFGPKPQAISHLPYNDLNAFLDAINDNTCAVMLEPLQGEGGIIAADPAFLALIREKCTQHNALLIFDEVQTGNGRTGYLYAYQHAGVTPDILTTAKGLGGGFPIGAMLTTEAIAQHFSLGTHGSTYGGNPLACAVADAVISQVSQPQLLAGVIERERWFREHLQHLNQKYHVFSEIRGQGLLLGAALNAQWQGRASDVVKVCGDAGLLLLVAGRNVVRMAPSLIITREEVAEGMARFDNALAALVR